jgi:hypothetical protein
MIFIEGKKVCEVFYYDGVGFYDLLLNFGVSKNVFGDGVRLE